MFLGDSTSEDFFNDCHMDKDKLKSLTHMIESMDCKYCILSHCEPLLKEDLLAYLNSIIYKILLFKNKKLCKEM